MRAQAVAVGVIVLCFAWVSVVFPTPAPADQLVMKDGRVYEWRALRDLGDSYEIESSKGQKSTVKKADVERIGPAPAQPLLTGATFTKLSGKVRETNCLALVPDPKRALVAAAGAEARIQSDRLVLDLRADSLSKLVIPAKMSDEYDLLLTVERKDGVSDFQIGLPLPGGHHTTVQIDADQGATTGGLLLPKDKPVAISCHVRADLVLVTVGQREVLNGDPKTFQAEPKPSLFVGSKKIFGTPANLWCVQRMTLTIKD